MQNLENIIKAVKDCIFPVFCLNCKKEGQWLCLDCFIKIEANGEEFCPICHKYNKNGAVCLECKSQSFLDSHLAIIKYEEDKLVGDLIHNFKYNYAEEIFGIFIKIITDYLSQNFYYFKDIDFIAPVPLHGRRLAERGFNQAELIADTIARIIGKKVENKIIFRHRYTGIQARLNKLDRICNVDGAFAMNNNEIMVKDKNILLVDDIFTTGSTLQECAKLLKINGAKKVLGFTLARG